MSVMFLDNRIAGDFILEHFWPILVHKITTFLSIIIALSFETMASKHSSAVVA
jgi:hypothetical protein